MECESRLISYLCHHFTLFAFITLEWHHNEHDCVSNHRRPDCLLNLLFRYKSKKASKSSVSLAFVRGIHRRPVNSPHKGPVTRKMFPFDYVIMNGKSFVFHFIVYQMVLQFYFDRPVCIVSLYAVSTATYDLCWYFPDNVLWIVLFYIAGFHI